MAHGRAIAVSTPAEPDFSPAFRFFRNGCGRRPDVVPAGPQVLYRQLRGVARTRCHKRAELLVANRTVRSSLVVAALTAPVLLLGTATAVAAPGASPGRQLTIETVSNPRPALVSGGQVLVKVVPSKRTRVTVSTNGHDVTSSFRAQPDGSLLGLVTGLRDGANDLSARTSGPGPDQRASLRVTNHPITGPVFSGSQQRPFYCETQAFGLPPASQPLCSAPTQVSYQYKTTAGAFAPLADPATRPADLATATVGGHAVPYVVRVERGTIDRAVYEMAALYDGTPSPVAPDARLEREAGLHLRRRLQRRLPPGQLDRRGGQRPVPRPGLRGRVVEPERARQQLQPDHLGRSGDDGQGALRRDLRPGRPHHRLGRLGRGDPAVRHRRELPRHRRRHHPRRLVPGPAERGRPGVGLPAC